MRILVVEKTSVVGGRLRSLKVPGQHAVGSTKSGNTNDDDDDNDYYDRAHNANKNKKKANGSGNETSANDERLLRAEFGGMRTFPSIDSFTSAALDLVGLRTTPVPAAQPDNVAYDRGYRRISANWTIPVWSSSGRFSIPTPCAKRSGRCAWTTASANKPTTRSTRVGTALSCNLRA